MKSEDKKRLLFGPYLPPRLKRGGFLRCAVRGNVRVGGWSNGPIPWPLAERTGGFLLCGDLENAVRHESVTAVAHAWGVRPETVSHWRAALAVPRSTPGTQKLCRQIAGERSTAAWSRKMVALARRPEARAKLSRAMTGKPMHPNLRKLFLAAAKRPKSENFKRLMRQTAIQRVRKGEIPFLEPEQIWTREEIQMVGRRPDKEVAAVLGRSVTAVKLKRQRLRLPKLFVDPKAWKPEELELLGTLPDAELAAKLRRRKESVEYMRIHLGKPYLASKSRPWTKSELRLLGNHPDAEIAGRTGRTQKAVWSKRVKLRLIFRTVRIWEPEEIQLLGRLPDAEVAQRTGRTLASVQVKRRILKLPMPEAQNPK